MSRVTRFTVLALSGLILVMTIPAIADAQRRAVPRHPSHPQRAVVVRGHVFIGGYFYDPFYGPYPWWPRTAYPYWYFPVYDNQAEVRLQVEPEEAEDAAVYVDGFYAGIVDDFNGVFQSLPLTPGGHTVVLYLEAYRTVRHNFYLSPGASFKLRATMERLAAGERSEPPELAPALPAPPTGTYRTPATTGRTAVRPPAVRPAEAVGFGTLDIFVQPASAEIAIDGQRWVTSDEGHFMVQVPVGKHRVEVKKSGYRQFTTEIEVGEGEMVPLNVSLMTTSS
jgi:PEGA domain